MLAKETINELSTILQEEFGVYLSDLEAYEVGISLVDLFDHLSEMDHRDMKNNEYEKIELHSSI